MDNKKVKALLLSWNPKNPEWNYKEAYFKVKNGEKSETDWRTKRTDGVEEKTEVFLIKLGDEEPKGIIAHGHVMEEPYLENGIHYVDVEFDNILDYENEKIIKQSDLMNKLPEQDWKLRASGIEIKETILPELREIWNKLINGDENSKNINRRENMKKEFDKNVIFYGPPGTGKTYENNQESKTNIKIENDIKYDVVDGIFKKFCDNARKAIIETHDNDDVSPEAIVWKVTVRNDVIKDCFENSCVRIDWNFDEPQAVVFVEEVKQGDIIITTDRSRTRINGIAVVIDNKGYILDKEERDTTTRNVKWLATNIDENIKSINKEKMLQRRTVARVPNMKVEDIIKLAKEKNPTALSKIDIKENTEPYVFIIDEINRGNISKIFGELITLIETTKRSGEGKYECISTKLPYSNEEFTVPDNVYIIGTMNTADRSIALMDTALRRRFYFEEMLPNYDLLKDIFVEDKGIKVNIGAMLKVINERIECLYDREHTIGHAEFLKLEKDNSIDKLENIFKKSVIPLLQEYFYEDYEKIRLILGDNAKSETEQFILAETIESKDIFEGYTSDIDIPEKKYVIKYDNFKNIMTYKNISQKIDLSKTIKELSKKSDE